jgi:hypothetical protein
MGEDNGSRKHPAAALLAYAMLGLVVVGAAVLGGYQVRAQQVPKDTVSTYVYDQTKEIWVKTVESIPVPEEPDGTRRTGTNTIEIRLNEDDPVKEIIIQEALITYRGDTSGRPLLEINGHELSTGFESGEIHIGKLVFFEVDAERLDIDADVVRVDIQNTVADDDELDLDLYPVNVVRIGRGASSSLFLGVSRSQTLQKYDTNFEFGLVDDGGVREAKRGLTSQNAGLRVDRIRIMGPSTGKGFVERLFIIQSSVFGDIKVENVAIQDLIIRSVSLDDSY